MTVTIVEEARPVTCRTAVTGGVDTHADTHVAAALDPVGRLLGAGEFPATAAGYARLLGWLGGFGTVALLAELSRWPECGCGMLAIERFQAAVVLLANGGVRCPRERAVMPGRGPGAATGVIAVPGGTVTWQAVLGGRAERWQGTGRCGRATAIRWGRLMTVRGPTSPCSRRWRSRWTCACSPMTARRPGWRCGRWMGSSGTVTCLVSGRASVTGTGSAAATIRPPDAAATRPSCCWIRTRRRLREASAGTPRCTPTPWAARTSAAMRTRRRTCRGRWW